MSHLVSLFNLTSLYCKRIAAFFAVSGLVKLIICCTIFNSSLSYAQNLALAKTNPAKINASIHLYAPNDLVAAQPVWLGIRLRHQPDWHSYWRNPGEIGDATSIKLNLPKGLSAGDILWPTPETFSFNGLESFGYSDDLLLSIPIQVDASFKPEQSKPITAQVNWLACKLSCIPESAELILDLPPQLPSIELQQLFDKTLANLPQDLPSQAEDHFYFTTANDTKPAQLNLRLHNLTAATDDLIIFPETAELIEKSEHWQQQSLAATSWQASAPLSEFYSGEKLAQLRFVLVNPKTKQSWRIQLPLQGQWPLLKHAAGASNQSAANSSAANSPFWLAIAAAALGGLLLNLMPCIFPILAIKALGIIQQQRHKQELRREGLFYTLGVVICFLLLACALLLIRQAGHAVGWGFQLQSPFTISVLISLMTIIGLNLTGLFEFSAILPASVAGKTWQKSGLNAFFSGILSVLIATPCTAPFMGVAIGITLTLPAYQLLAIFLTMGLAMAAPYLLFCWLPGVAKLLPQPGAWMTTFKQLMAFPMFLTALWLLWVLGQQAGIDAIVQMLLVLLALSFLLWSLTLASKRKMILIGIGIIALMASSHFHAVHLNQQANSKQLTTASANSIWQPWSEAKVQQYLANGKTVFIDYTAAWCITCQYNKKTTLSNPAVLAAFAKKAVVLLRADWSLYQPEITQSLATYGRNGVPTYVLQAPNKPAIVLTEILSTTDLLAIVNQL